MKHDKDSNTHTLKLVACPFAEIKTNINSLYEFKN
jgi:hypothetical protein